MRADNVARTRNVALIVSGHHSVCHRFVR